MATKRHLAAIMFTDITGYSTMMGADIAYAKRIRDRHRSVFRSTHESYGGKILQYYGDGTLSIFDSATDAVECAVEMQIELRKEPQVPLRIGIHTGDISYDDEGAYGDGLNIAARVERLCIPGGVYITAKVFDDIKNHPWLTAISLGFFKLRNIHRDVEIYAINCKGIVFPEDHELRRNPEFVDKRNPSGVPDPVPVTASPKEEIDLPPRKQKGRAVVLAFFVGYFGIHRLYLGQRKWGFVHMALAILAIVLTSNGIGFDSFPPAAIMGIVWLVDFVLLLAMSRADFDYKYNRGLPDASKQKLKRKRERDRVGSTPTPSRSRQRRTREEAVNPAMLKGITLYKQDRFDEAMEEFKRALNIEPGSPAAYFNLACIASIKNDTRSSFEYLSKAVQNGFDDFERIHEHEALVNLRSHEHFDTFANNGFVEIPQLPAPAENLLDTAPLFNPEVLDRIEELGELLERGELSRDEFDAKKRELLGGDDNG